MKKEYIIQGRFKDGNWYMYTLAGYSLEHAKSVLNKVIANPAKYSYKHKLYSEFRLLEVESGRQWWNKGALD